MPDKHDRENSCFGSLNNKLNDFIHTKSNADVHKDIIVNKYQNMKPLLQKREITKNYKYLNIKALYLFKFS